MSGLDPLTWAILLMLLGCALVVVEVFLPSGGLLSFFAAVAIVASVIFAFRKDVSSGLLFILVTLVAVPTVVALAFKYWPKTPIGKAFLGELPGEEETKLDDPRRQLVGRVGTAKSLMLPAGSVMIDGKLFDAISKGAPIDPGQAVVVVEVRANRVVVRPADPDEAKRQSVVDEDVLSKPVDELGLESLDEPLS